MSDYLDRVDNYCDNNESYWAREARLAEFRDSCEKVKGKVYQFQYIWYEDKIAIIDISLKEYLIKDGKKYFIYQKQINEIGKLDADTYYDVNNSTETVNIYKQLLIDKLNKEITQIKEAKIENSID